MELNDTIPEVMGGGQRVTVDVVNSHIDYDGNETFTYTQCYQQTVCNLNFQGLINLVNCKCTRCSKVKDMLI